MLIPAILGSPIPPWALTSGAIAATAASVEKCMLSKRLCSYYGITRGALCGGFKEANDKCEPMKTSRLNGLERETRGEPRIKAGGIKTSEEKVKNRSTQDEESLLMKGHKIARQRDIPAEKFLNLTMAHRSLSRQGLVKPKRIQASCRGHPWSLTRYQLPPRSSGFASARPGL